MQKKIAQWELCTKKGNIVCIIIIALFPPIQVRIATFFPLTSHVFFFFFLLREKKITFPQTACDHTFAELNILASVLKTTLLQIMSYINHWTVQHAWCLYKASLSRSEARVSSWLYQKAGFQNSIQFRIDRSRMLSTF